MDYGESFSSSPNGSLTAAADPPAKTTALIEITQFINPHLFWFKCSGNRRAVGGAKPTVLATLEAELDAYVLGLTDRQLISVGYRPRRGETVAVRHMVWNKWIRAHVDEVLEYNSQTFVLWAIDHGTSLESTQRHIRPLSGHLATQPNRTVFRGGIGFCQPVESRFDYMRMQSDLVPSTMWSEAAVRQIEEMFAGDEIQFTVQLLLEEPTEENGETPAEEHYFGDVQVLTPAGQRVNAAAVLTKMGQARPMEKQAFADWILAAQTRNVKRFHNNSQQSVQRRNELLIGGAATTSSRIKNILMGRNAVTEVAPYVEQKIDNWMQRNQSGPVAEDDDDDDDASAWHLSTTMIVRKPTRPPNNMPSEPVGQADAQASGISVADVQMPPSDAGLPVLNRELPDDHPLMMRLRMRNRVIRSVEERERLQREEAEKLKKAEEEKLKKAAAEKLEQEAAEKLENEIAKQVQAAAELEKISAELEKRSAEEAKAVAEKKLAAAEQKLIAIKQQQLEKKMAESKLAAAEQNLIAMDQQPHQHNNRNAAIASAPLQQILKPQTVEKTPTPMQQHFNQSAWGALPIAPAPVKTQFSAAVPIGYALKDLHTFNRPFGDAAAPSQRVARPQLRAASPPRRIAVPSGGSQPSSTQATATTGGGAEQCLKNSLHLHRVLVHGVHRPQPLESIHQANFTDVVHDALRRSRYTELYRTQAYTWPHLLRGNSVMLINGPGTGKTIAYLPAVCSLVQEAFTDGRVPKGVGPVAIVLCVSAQQVARVAMVARHYMGTAAGSLTEWSVVEAYGRRDTRRIKADLFNGCALLVTTAPCWHRLLLGSEQPLIDAQRLRLLVLDDLDLIVERFRDDLTAVYTRMTLLQREHRKQLHKTTAAEDQLCGLQLVVTARRWRHELDYFFCTACDLVLVIGAYAEAAVYARSHIQLHRMRTAAKMDALLAALRERDYRQQPTLVVCNEAAEAREVVTRLRQELIDCVQYHEQCDDHHQRLAIAWNRSSARNIATHTNPTVDAHTVLVCTDRTIGDLRLSNAQNIVHFSIPHTWTAFAYRCSSSFDYFEDFVRNRDAVRPPPHLLVLLDEHNNVQLPRLIEFLEQHGVAVDDAAIQRLAARCRRHIEHERTAQLMPFCRSMLLVGECIIAGCPRRHVLTAGDGSDALRLPLGGHVRMVVLRIVTATEFWVRVVATRDRPAVEWRPARDFVFFSLSMANWYGRAENRVALVDAVQAGVLAVIEEEDVFHRCRVMAIKKTKMSHTVEVFLIDAGKQLPACHPSELLQLADQFRHLPDHSVSVRIADCVPCDGDAEWDASATQAVTAWLAEHSAGDDVHIEGRIEFTVLNTLWLDSVRLIERLPVLAKEVHLLSVRHQLVRQNFGVLNGRAAAELRRMAADAGLSVGGTASSAAAPAEDVVCDPDADGETADVMPSIDAAVDGDAIVHVSPVTQPAIVGGTPDKLRGRRTMRCPSRRSDDLASLLDVQAQSPPQARTEQPMQPQSAILAEDCFEPVFIMSFFRPDLFYVQIHSHVLNDLHDAIDRVIADKTIAPDTNFAVGSFCLALYDGHYHRARIEGISCQPPERLEVVLFFVDLGKRSKTDVQIEELIVLPDSLLRIAPFQAIRCQLAGVRPPFGTVTWSTDLCDRIFDEVLSTESEVVFVRVVRPMDPTPERVYEVVAIEWRDETAQDINLNRKMVELELAEYDASAEHLLDVQLTADEMSGAYSRHRRLAASEDDIGEEENWDNEDHPSYIRQIEDKRLDGENEPMKHFDVQFTDQEILALLNLPPTTKLLPPEGAAQSTSPQPIADKLSAEVATDRLAVADETDAIAAAEFMHMPRLRATTTYKQPQVRWQQNETAIYLSIEAPDVNEYRLHVTNRLVRVHARLHNNHAEPSIVYCVLHLFGPVATEYTSHEVRGLWLRVRLTKLVRGPKFVWPRLTRQPLRLSWLRYNLDAIDGLHDGWNDDWRQPHSQYRGCSESSGSDEADDEAVDERRISDFEYE